MVEDGAVLATIFEERSAVTQVCWNPNILFGGVAAAAMGSGLVRVEDLAI
jgi:transcription factor C subunit 6